MIGLFLAIAIWWGIIGVGPAWAASAAAEETMRNAPAGLLAQAMIDRLDSAIAVEKRQPAPDAYFLLWTLARKAALLGNKSNVDEVGNDGVGRPADAVKAAQEALPYADRATKPQNIIGPPPIYLKYQLLSLIGRRSLDQFARQQLAFDTAHPVSLDLDRPHPPRPRWETQPEAKQLDRQAETALRQALALETADPAALWQPSGQDRLLVRRLLVDILWRQERWRDLFLAVLDLENLIRGDGYLQSDLSALDRTRIDAKLRQLPGAYTGHIDLLRHGREPGGQLPSAEETGLFFKVLQATQANEDALTLDRLAARFSPAEPGMAEELRQLQSLVDAKRQQDRLSQAQTAAQLDAIMAGQVQGPQPTPEAISRSVDLAHQIRDLWSKLAREHPALADAVSPPVIDIAEVQQRLGPEDALAAFYTDRLEVISWVVTKTSSDYSVDQQIGGFVPGGPREATTRLIERLRRGIDTEAQPFNIDAAYDLYRRLFGAARPMLAGVKHLYIVPDALLRSLPFEVLVSAAPPAELPNEDYRAVHWLIRDQALTLLPTVASLRSIAVLRERPEAPQALIAFADPVLSGKPDRELLRGVPVIKRDGRLAAPGELRKLPALPDTKNEVEAVATSLGAPADDLYLGERASERAVKSAPLEDFRVVYFATHALLPDENSLGQPAIVLTPPDAPTPEDDGLLTADEIGALRLNADWVVLSACNTAGPVGRGLSGLARAFLFAGARSLLVSNWYVASADTARLMASLFANYAREPAAGRSEALRRAMLDALDHAATPQQTHPLFWAPFALVGDGGPRG